MTTLGATNALPVIIVEEDVLIMSLNEDTNKIRITVGFSKIFSVKY
jgi:hypothetical protein